MPCDLFPWCDKGVRTVPLSATAGVTELLITALSATVLPATVLPATVLPPPLICQPLFCHPATVLPALFTHKDTAPPLLFGRPRTLLPESVCTCRTDTVTHSYHALHTCSSVCVQSPPLAHTCALFVCLWCAYGCSSSLVAVGTPDCVLCVCVYIFTHIQ